MRLIRLGLAATAVIITIALVLLAGAHLPLVRQRAFDWARTFAAEKLGVVVEAEAMGYNLLSRSVTLSHPSFAVKGDRPFFSADSVRLTLGRSLWRGTVRVESLAILQPRLTIVRHADNTTNLPPSQPDPSSSGPAPVHLGQVALRQFSVQIDDELASRSLSGGPLDLSIDTSATGAPPGAFGPSPFAIGLSAIDMPPGGRTLAGTLSGRVGFDGSRLSLLAFSVDMPEGRVALSGWIDVLAETQSLDLQGQLDLDLARAARLAGLEATAAGSGRAQFTIGGALVDPVVTVELAGHDLAYRSLSAATVSGKATYAAGLLTIDAFDLVSPFGAASLSGELPVAAIPGSPRSSRLRARLTNLDLDPLLHSAGVVLPLRLGSSASGVFNLTLKDADPFGPDWLEHLAVDGSATMTPSGSGASLGGRITVRLENANWTIGHVLQSTTARASLSGEVAGRIDAGATGAVDSTLSGRSHLRLDELAALLPLARQAGVQLPPALDQGVGGSVDAGIEPRGTIAVPRALATISGRSIRVADLPEGALESTVAIDRRRVEAQSLNVSLGPARLLASGTYTWTGRIDAQFAAAADDLDALVRSLAVTDVSVAGSARLEGSVQGDVRTPRARGALTAHDLAVAGTPVGALTATLDLADWQLSADARAADLSAQLRGNVDTREPFAYRAEAMLEGTSVAALLPVSMRASIPLSEGAVSATLRAQGMMQQPLESTGELALRNLDAVVSGIPVHLEAPASIGFEPGVFTATPIQLRAGAETSLRLQGALALDRPREGLEVSMASTLSELLDLAGPAFPELMLEARDSRLEIDLRVGGTIRRPEPAGTIALRAAALQYADLPPLTDLAVAAGIDRMQISLQSLSATWQNAKLAGGGRVPLRMIVPETSDPSGAFGAWRTAWLNSLPGEQTAASLNARLTNITAEALAPFVEPSRRQEISGLVSASLTADADAFTLDSLRASMTLDEASLTLAGVPFAQSVPTRVRLENGTARIESLRWNAQGNEVVVTGDANLSGASPSLDLAIAGDVDLRVVGAFATGVASGGLGHANLTVTGPAAAPVVVGSIGITAGELRIDSPPVAASDFDGSLAIDAGGRASVALKGLINGGSATVSGDISLKNLSEPRGGATLTARNVMLDYPDGFQTESNLDLTLTLGDAGSTLAGGIELMNGIYREPIVLSRGLVTGLTRGNVPTPATPSPFLASLRLDIAVSSAEAVRIDNNYGRLNLAANVKITGTAVRPGAVGRIEALPDGEIYLVGNTYRVQNLVIDLENPAAIAPELTFLAETRVNNVPIDVSLRCTAAGPCEREVRSQTTGVTDEQAEAWLFGVPTDPAAAGAQLASLLSGEVLGVVGRTVGLDTLRLETSGAASAGLFDDPSLLAGDVNPASRLTFGKRIGERVELAYSQDLAENGFTTSTSYTAPGGISLRALLLDDQSRSYEFRHEPRFGRRRPQQRPAPRPIVSAVTLGGTPGFSDDELRDRLRLSEGDRFDFATWQADRARLGALYRSRGFFEARVRARQLPVPREAVPPGAKDPDTERVTLAYTIDRGAPTRLEISGATLPDALRDRIVERWTGAIFDGFLERDVTLIVREHMYREGRLEARVTAVMQTDAASRVKTLQVHVDPGAPKMPRLEFDGNSLIATSRLDQVAKAAGPFTAWLDPAALELVIERLYQEDGLLSAEVDVLAPEDRGDESVVRVVIREGAPWPIGRVTLRGAEGLPGGGAASAVDLPAGSRFTPAIINAQVAALEQRFRAAGFLDVRVAADTALDQKTHAVDVGILATPGPRSVLTSVVVEGSRPDSPIIARSLDLAVGMPVDAAAVSDTRRRLYDTGLYRRVDIDLQPGAGAPDPPASQTDGDRDVVARIYVEERPRYAFRYGFQLNDDVVGTGERSQRAGFSADLESRNLLGLGATAGVSARLRRDQQIGRVFVGANRFFGLPLRSNLFFSRGREAIGSDETLRTVSDVTEVSAEQTYRLRRFIDLRYGYGLGRNRTTIAGAGSDFDLSVKVARLTTSAIVDRRSDPFDPARGWFAAASFETSRPRLGSDISFVKSFLQYFQFVPIGGKVLIASAARVGLARTYRDEDLIPSERFFGGGATSVRGYRQDDLGPRSIFGDASGGRALFAGNGEIRFPLYRWAKGVGFVDVGNVYETVGDLSLSKVQIGTGAGIRLSTPIGLLRLDIAVPTNRRPFDPKWTTYFGLGHAF